MTAAYVHPVDLRFHEVDSVGVVFNAWYLAWADDARLRYAASLARAGVDVGHGALVRHADIEWLASMRLGDRAEVHVTPVRVGRTSFTLRHLVVRVREDDQRGGATPTGREEAAVLTITYVSVGPDLRPAPLTAGLRAALEAGIPAA